MEDRNAISYATEASAAGEKIGSAFKDLIFNWGSHLIMRESHMQGAIRNALYTLNLEFAVTPFKEKKKYWKDRDNIMQTATAKKGLIEYHEELLGEKKIRKIKNNIEDLVLNNKLTPRKMVYQQLQNLCEQTPMNEEQKANTLQFFKWGFLSGKSETVRYLVMTDRLPDEAMDKNHNADNLHLRWN